MRHGKLDICVMVLGGLLAGCTMLAPAPMQPVQVSSTPPGAAVQVDGWTQTGTTPLTVTLDPRRTHEVQVGKACYTAAPVMVQPVMVKRQLVGTVYDLVEQLPPAVHVDLTPTCAAGRTS